MCAVYVYVTKEELDTVGLHVAIDAGFSVPSRVCLSVCLSV
jgi:hypothetical protein